MLKRLITWVVLISYTIFYISCTNTVRVTPDYNECIKNKLQNPILKIVTKEGEYIQFAAGNTGRIHDDCVSGYVTDSTVVKLPTSDIKRNIRNAGGQVALLWVANGEKYHVVNLLSESADTISFITTKPKHVDIPLKSIDTLYIKKTNVAGTVSAVTFGVVILLMIASSSNKNLPAVALAGGDD